MTERRRVYHHPGIYVKDAIDALGLSQSEFALRTGLSIKNVSTLINGESNITFDVAIKLAAFFDNSVEGWINLQTAYNLFLNEEKKEKEYQEDWSIAKQFDKTFVQNFLQVEIKTEDKKTVIDKLRKCFNVVNLQNLKSPDMYAFCRTSTIKDVSDKMIIMRNAWISLAEKEAREMACDTFNKEMIVDNVKYLRSLTLEEPNTMSRKLRNFLSKCGIKLVILPYLSGSNISGVTKWIANENCVMVAVNDCGKDADKIWFSIFHELGHAIKNHKRHLTISLNKNNIIDEEENEANAFARDSLLDKDGYEEFLKRNDFSISSIKKFARSQTVAPFVVIGRLQKDGIIGWEKYQNYKTKYEIQY